MLQTVPPALRQRGLIFHEDFCDTASVIKNGGTITSTPLTVPKRFTGNGSAYIQYPSMKNYLSGITKFTISINNVVYPPGVGILLSTSTPGAVYFGFLAATRNVFFWIGGSTYAKVTATFTPYTIARNITFVYDGTQAVSSNRTLIYIDGVSVPITQTGAIQQTTDIVGSNMFVGSYTDATSKMPANTYFDSVYVFNTALTANEVLSLYKNDWSLSTSGK